MFEKSVTVIFKKYWTVSLSSLLSRLLDIFHFLHLAADRFSISVIFFFCSQSVWLFAKCIKCKETSPSRRVLRCCVEVNPRCLYHLNKGLVGRRSPPPPLWFSQRWGWVSSISTFLLSWPLRLLILPSLEVWFQPCQAKYTWFVPRISVWACMFMYESVWIVSVSSVLAVTAGLWSRELTFCFFLSPLALNTLSCGLWQHWWAPLDYKTSLHLIGMLFWFKWARLITAVDNTHNMMLQYVRSGSYTDLVRDDDRCHGVMIGFIASILQLL